MQQLGGKLCFHPKMRQSRGNLQHCQTKGRKNKRQSCPTAPHGTCWANWGRGNTSRPAWSCEAVGVVSPSPVQHSSAQEGEKGPCNRLWALGNPQELPWPGTFSGSTISTFPALVSCPAAPSESCKKQNCPCKMSKTHLSPSVPQTLCTAPV